MTLKLDYTGEEYEQGTIINFNPQNPYDSRMYGNTPTGRYMASQHDGEVWWATGFNPHIQGVNHTDLFATFTVDFSGMPGMYEAFVGSDPFMDEDSWSDLGGYKLQLEF